MSDTSTLTRCPHCQTRFRVTEKQLGAAGGKVRCGQCRQVFNALDNAESEAPEPEPVQTEQQEQTEREEPSSTAEQQPTADSSQQNTGDAPSGDDEDEELVFDDDPEEDAREGRYAGKKPSIDESEFDEEFLALERGESLAFSEFLDDSSDQSQHSGEDDESWAESLLQDDDWDMPDPRPLETEDHEAAYREMLEGSGQAKAEAEAKPGPQPQPQSADETGTDRQSSPEPEGDWRSLRTEPIAAPRSERPAWYRRVLWSAIALAAAAALVHQLGWAHWDRLARYEPIRPVYAQVCDWLGCELPPLQAIDQIQSRQMVVRSHPEHDNALLVEATLLNQAGFDQPFPAIALSFANLNNDVVAQRVFQPRDYLPDGTDPDDTIPAGTGVRVSLSLQDPGRDAINYRLDFLPAQ